MIGGHDAHERQERLGDERLVADHLPATVEWRHKCPECGTEMIGTGTVVHRDDPPTWLVELWCAKDEEVFTIWTSDLEVRVTAHLGKA